MPAGRRLVEAEAGRQCHADADRHVHVGAAMLEHAPGRAEEGHAGKADRRNRNQCRDQMEHLTRCAFGAVPDADRELHDVHRCKGGDGKRCEQGLGGSRRRRVILVARLAGKADGRERTHQRGGLQLRRMGDAHLPGGQVDTGGADARQLAQRTLHLRHAPGAVHGGDDEDSLLHPGRKAGCGLAHGRSCSVRKVWPSSCTRIRSRQRFCGIALVET